jgi:hypothetical protein
MGIEKCSPLFLDEFSEKRTLLFETLRNVGLKIPAEFAASKKE